MPRRRGRRRSGSDCRQSRSTPTRAARLSPSCRKGGSWRTAARASRRVDTETAELLPALQSQPTAKRAKAANNGGRERRIERRQLADALWGTLTIGALVLAPELDRDGTYLAGW